MSNKPIQTIALFAGSFDPFTLGHYALVERMLTLFDEVIIAIGVSEYKTPLYTVEQRTEMLSSFYRKNPSVHVMSYRGLTCDFAKAVGATCMVRGVRSVADFEYERTVADTNKALTGIDTVLLLGNQEYNHISSTLIRELMRYNKPVEPFLPEGLQLP